MNVSLSGREKEKRLKAEGTVLRSLNLLKEPDEFLKNVHKYVVFGTKGT